MDDENKKYNCIFSVTLAVFLLFNLFTIKDYGLTWDEPAQHSLGQAEADYLQNVTDKVEYARDDLIYYGPFFEILNRYFGKWMMGLGFEYADAFHILIIFAAVLGLFFSYRLISALINPRAALIAVSLLMLSPRFAAHSHYNPKDIPLMAGFAASLYFLYVCFKQKKSSSAVWAGISIGLSLSVRADAILALPVFFLPYVIQIIIRREWNLKKDFKFLGMIIGVTFLTVFMVWPSLWLKPLVLFESFIFFLRRHGWDNDVLYLGQNFTSRNLPWHYALFYIFGTFSIFAVLPMIIGFFESAKRLREKTVEYGILICWPIIRILIAVIPGSTRYDGMRHYIFILPALAAISALGFEYIFKKIKNLKVIIVLAVLIAIWLAAEFARIYPYGDSYFNEIVRAVYPKNIEKKIEIEYWGSSYREGIVWLNKNADKNSVVCVPVADHLIFYYPIRRDIQIGCVGKPDYLMFITRQTFIPKNLNDLYKYADLEPVFKVSRYNSNLLYIYQLR